MNRAQSTATTIPAKSPKVTVTEPDSKPGSWVGVCHVDGCDWSYENVVKGDVKCQASWHRQAHRSAASR